MYMRHGGKICNYFVKILIDFYAHILHGLMIINEEKRIKNPPKKQNKSADTQGPQPLTFVVIVVRALCTVLRPLGQTYYEYAHG